MRSIAWRELITNMIKSCKLHPRYKGVRAPRSKKSGCVCNRIYKQRKKLHDVATCECTACVVWRIDNDD